MRKTILIWILCLGSVHTVQGQQGVQLLQSGEVNARGGLQTSLQGISSFFGNTAGLATITSFSFLAGGESRYLGTDITAGGAGAALPTSAGVLGVGVAYFGNSAYSEQQFQISFSKKLLDKFSLSIRGYLTNTNIDQYGSTFLVSGDIGAQAYLTKKLTLGFLLVNPAQTSLADGSDLPTIFLLGANYDFGKTFSVGLEFEKNLNQAEAILNVDPNTFINPGGRINVKGGIAYRPNEKFSFRLGIKSVQPEYSFGMGYRFSERFWIDAVGTYHEILGFTPGVTLRYIGK